jgi:hypothetical protein
MKTISIVKIKNSWKQLARDKKVTSKDVIAMALYRALASKANDKVMVARSLMLQAFSPITNSNKLWNGMKEFGALNDALFHVNMVAQMVPEKLPFAEHLDEADRQEVQSLIRQVRENEFVDTTYAYFFVRQDISHEQQMVQAAHVAMVLGQDVAWQKHDAHNLHFIIFGVPNLEALLEKWNFLYRKGIEFKAFNEPDLGSTITAIACNPMRKSKADRKKLFVNDTLLVMGEKAVDK